MICSLNREKTTISSFSSLKKSPFSMIRVSAFFYVVLRVSRLALVLFGPFQFIGNSSNKDTVEFCVKLQILMSPIVERIVHKFQVLEG